MKIRNLWLIGARGFFSGLAMALDQARKQGRVGETLSGYIAPVKQDAETLAMVKRINAGRAENIRNWPTANRPRGAHGGAKTGDPVAGRPICARHLRPVAEETKNAP